MRRVFGNDGGSVRGSIWIACVLASLVVMAGCSGGSAPVAVSVSPGSAQALDQGQKVQFAGMR